MLKKIPFISVIIITAILAFMVLPLFFKQNFSKNLEATSINNTEFSDTSFAGYFFSSRINDSLPHYKYKQVEDSLDEIKHYREGSNKVYWCNSWSIGCFGIEEMFTKKDFTTESNISFKKRIAFLDSLTFLRSSNKITETQLDSFISNISNNPVIADFDKAIPAKGYSQTFYLLTDYQLDDSEKKFYATNNKWNLIYYVTDSIKKQNNRVNKIGHYESKQIGVWYDKENKQILIPISQKRYNFLDGCHRYFTLISYLIILVVMVALPIKIIINVARGKAFIRQNISYLRIIASTIMLSYLTNLFMPYILNFHFRNIIPSDFILEPFWYKLYSNISTLFLAVMVFIVAKAFSKGSKLQHEQDLTV